MSTDFDTLVLEPRELFDKAVIGLIERCGQPPIVCYSRPLLLDLLMEDGRDYHQAQEYIDVNISGCWAGPGTWAVLDPMGIHEIESFLE